MDILLTLVGAILGWFANHYYSRQGSKELRRVNDELRALVQKMPAEFVAALRTDERESLTVPELNRLLHDITLDPATGELVACQQCGSENLARKPDVEVDWDDGQPSLSYFVDFSTCEDCGWSQEAATAPSGELLYIRAHQPV